MARLYTYTSEQLQKLVNKYFEDIENRFVHKYDVVKIGKEAGKELKIKIPVTPSKIGIVDFLNIDKTTWLNWGNDSQNNKELFTIVTHANAKIEKIQQEMVNAGLANPMIIARLQGLTDKQDITTNGENLGLSIHVTRDEAKQLSEQLEKEL